MVDVNGLDVPVDQKLVGMTMPGGDPLVDFTIPAGAIAKAGAGIACPPELVTAIDTLFRDSCLTEETRKATAAANSIEPSVVEQRCKDNLRRAQRELRPRLKARSPPASRR